MHYLIEKQLKEMVEEAINEKFTDTRWDVDVKKVVIVKPPHEDITGRVIFKLKEKNG